MLNHRSAPKRPHPQNNKKQRPFKQRRPASSTPGREPREAREAREAREVRPPRPDYSQYERREPKTYGVIFFDTFNAAKAEPAKIKAECANCDQLNVVIRAEGDMDDRELLGLDPKVKIFAGTAWALIHDRRVEDGWYKNPQ